MAIADRSGLPVAVCTTSASPHEVTLVEDTLDEIAVDEEPQQLIGDKAYDSDELAVKLAFERQIELIAPPRRNNQQSTTWNERTQDLYKNRWKIERLFSWLHGFRRIVIRWEYYVENFLGFIHLACSKILLERF
jgi:transposase